MNDDRPEQHPGDEVDPEDFLRRMLAISPEDAAEVREDAAHPKTLDVELVADEVVVAAWTVPQWREPEDEYEVSGKRYEVTGYLGPFTRENGRTLYRVVAKPTD